MAKEENVINYYMICNRLKSIIRTGWKNWNVKKDRLESVAEHIFGVQMLAIAMNSEYEYEIDIMKVIYMIAIHELGEAIIGDITQFEKSNEEKKKLEHEAVHKILKNLVDGKTIEKLFIEFDDHTSKESQFAFQCDKLECDIQSKIYDQEGCVDLENQKNNIALEDKRVRELCSSKYSWSTMWLKYGQENYNYDKNFLSVSNYVMNNNIKAEIK